MSNIDKLNAFANRVEGQAVRFKDKHKVNPTQVWISQSMYKRLGELIVQDKKDTIMTGCKITKVLTTVGNLEIFVTPEVGARSIKVTK